MKTDTTKLAAELRRYNSWRRNDETIDQPEPMILGKIIDNAADRLEDLQAELAAERAQIEANHKVTRIIEEMLYAERALADRMAALLQRDRDGYGGQVVDPACDCCDCEYLGPIDASLAAWREARRQADPDHDSRDETTYDELP